LSIICSHRGQLTLQADSNQEIHMMEVVCVMNYAIASQLMWKYMITFDCSSKHGCSWGRENYLAHSVKQSHDEPL